MSHEIDMTTGTASIFVTGEPAWHRLGKVVTEAQTSAEAIRLAGLDWSVEQAPLMAEIPVTIDGETVRQRIEVEGKFANYRSDTKHILGTVGRWYRPFQNAEAFDFMDNIVGEKLAMFETAGALKEGRRVWMLARLPQEIRVAGDDVVKPYVLITNSHDGSTGLRILPTTVRVVCNNTLTLALRNGLSEGLSIVHTDSLDQRVAEARQKLGVIAKRVDRFTEETQALAKRSLSTEELTAYFCGLVADRAEKSQQKMLGAFLEGFENERNQMPGIKGSAWSAFNAVTEWADHQMAVTGKSEAERLDGRVNSIWFGAANKLKQTAYRRALELVS